MADDSAPDEAPGRLRRWLGPRLLSWFDANRRDLPWRRDRDPYRIWVSEVMLQQTQVATVIPYFSRFLDRFPTLADLAQADEQDVLRLWEGLGYYRRARDLLRSARLIAERHGGVFPRDPADLEGLPGLGTYTRNAVLSQAFDLPLPILEANSQRLLSRLFGHADDPRQGPARKRLWHAAEQVMPARRAGDFNQALMELGALVCVPDEPRCGECPLSPRCEAFRQGRQQQIPARTPPPAPTLVREVAVAVWRGGRVLLVQRHATASRWANLWELPHAEQTAGEEDGQTAGRLLASLGVRAALGPELTTIEHGVTRFRITLVCLEASHVEGAFRPGLYADARWLTTEELAAYPVSSPQRRLIRAVSRPDRQGTLFG